MRLREFFDYLGIVLLVLLLTAIVVAFMLCYEPDGGRRGPPALVEDEQWGDEWR